VGTLDFAPDSVNPRNPQGLPLLYNAFMSRTKRPPDFEKSLTELEELVEKLEGGDLPLDEALKTFERGISLTRDCQSALEAAQARVDVLLKREDGSSELAPFDTGVDEEAVEDE